MTFLSELELVPLVSRLTTREGHSEVETVKQDHKSLVVGTRATGFARTELIRSVFASTPEIPGSRGDSERSL